MNNEVNNQQNVENNNLISNEEKTTKKKILKTILGVIGILLIGIISGSYLLKAINSGVKENTFMYDILKSSGLLMQNEKAEELPTATDSDYEYATDSNAIAGLTFIQEKDGCKYYYYINEDGDYLYYYSYTDDIYNYYASDSNGHYINETYNDYVPSERIYVTVPDFTKIKIEDLYDYYNFNINVLYVPNSQYAENSIYYQNVKAGEKLELDDEGFTYTNITILVNKAAE